MSLDVRQFALKRHVPARATYSGPQRLVGMIETVFRLDDNNQGRSSISSELTRQPQGLGLLRLTGVG